MTVTYSTLCLCNTEFKGKFFLELVLSSQSWLLIILAHFIIPLPAEADVTTGLGKEKYQLPMEVSGKFATTLNAYGETAEK